MRYSEELKDRVKNKKFKTFWHCMEYLIDASYSPFEAFNISLLEFGDNGVFSEVAFFDIDDGVSAYTYPLNKEISKDLDGVLISNDDGTFSSNHFNAYNTVTRTDYTITRTIKVALMNVHNAHLSNLFNMFRKIRKGSPSPETVTVNQMNGINFDEFENACDKLVIGGLTQDLIDILAEIGERHYGEVIIKSNSHQIIRNYVEKKLTNISYSGITGH